MRRWWEADEARSNASLMNLVIYAERAGALADNSAIIHELTREHACRAILVELDRDQPEVTTRAWITAHCHLADGRKSVCCEQLAFALTGRSTGRLRNVVFAHLNSDLPLVFWWQGELSPIFMESLYSVIDRLIIDSAGWADPRAGFGRIAAALADTGGRLVVHDLEWTRGGAFRLALAALFDDPVLAGRLAGLDRVRVIHRAGHRCAAVQMVAWLAVQAGWRCGRELGLGVARRGKDVEGFSFEHPDGRAVAVVVEQVAAGPALQRLVMEGESFRAEVVAGAEETHLRATREVGGRHEEFLRPAGPAVAGRLVGELLSRGGRNGLFVKVLPTALEMLE